MIPMSECVEWRVYRVRARNFSYAVYIGSDAIRHGRFLGLRKKFGDTFLFIEFHDETGPPHGTVIPLEDTGIDVPEGLRGFESLVSYPDGLFDWLEGVTNDLYAKESEGGKQDG